MPTVSVIVPVYRVEKYLDRCVASAAGQTLRDLEILLVDDASPDACPALCDAWAARDRRVRVLHRAENGGLSAARNTGLDAAAGEFVFFLDSDDTLEPDALQALLDAQRRTGADLVLCNLRYVDENLTPLPAPDFSAFADEVLSEDEIWARYFALAETKIYYVVAWNKLYRRGLLEHLRFAEGKRYEDQFLLPHVLAQCGAVACLAKVGYNYTQRPGSIMADGSSRRYLDRPEFMLEWAAYFAAKGDALRAEGLLNDAARNLGEGFDLSDPAARRRFAAARRACADVYADLARRTGRRTMALRAALLRVSLKLYLAFLKVRSF